MLHFDETKPVIPFITINGDVYKKIDCDFHHVGIYQNDEKQRLVKIWRSGFFQTWSIELWDSFIWTDDLSLPLTCDETKIPTYLNPKQLRALDRIVEEALIQTEK